MYELVGDGIGAYILLKNYYGVEIVGETCLVTFDGLYMLNDMLESWMWCENHVGVCFCFEVGEIYAEKSNEVHFDGLTNSGNCVFLVTSGSYGPWIIPRVIITSHARLQKLKVFEYPSGETFYES